MGSEGARRWEGEGERWEGEGARRWEVRVGGDGK